MIAWVVEELWVQHTRELPEVRVRRIEFAF